MIKSLLLATLLASAAAYLVLDGGTAGWGQWSRSIDGVMGGRSSISVRIDGAVLEATGTIVTAGGGFAGVFRRLDGIDASSHAGLRVTYEALPADAIPVAWEIRLKGRGDTSWRVDFGACFAVQPSADPAGVGSVSLPFEEFLPRWRGSDRGATLDLTALTEVGLQLLFQDGPFALRLLEIALVDDVAPPDDPPPAAGADPAAVAGALDAAAGRGDYLVGKGYDHQAVAVLAAAARAGAAALAGVPGAGDARAALAGAAEAAAAIPATDEPGRLRALRAGLDAARAAAAGAGAAWARSYAEVGRVCRPKNGDGYAMATVEGGAAACQALCDADAKCGAWEYENHAVDDRECELYERDVVDVEATAAQGPCQTSDPEDYRCCHVDEVLMGAPQRVAINSSAADGSSVSNNSGGVTSPQESAAGTRQHGIQYQPRTMMVAVSMYWAFLGVLWG